VELGWHSRRTFESPPEIRPGLAFDTGTRRLFSGTTLVVAIAVAPPAFIALVLITSWTEAIAEVLSSTAGLALALFLGEEVLYRRNRIHKLRDLEGSRHNLAALILKVCLSLLQDMQRPTADRVHWNQFNESLHERQLVDGHWIVDACAAFWETLRAAERSIAEKHPDWIDANITDEDIADAGLGSRDSLVDSADLVISVFDESRLDVAVWLGQSQPSSEFALTIQQLFFTRTSWDYLRDVRSPAMYLSASKETLTALTAVGASLAGLPTQLAPSVPVPR
jgi:hypothetical protein